MCIRDRINAIEIRAFVEYSVMAVANVTKSYEQSEVTVSEPVNETVLNT